MSDHDETTRRFVRDMFAQAREQQPPPEDVVRPAPRPLDRAELLRHNEETGWHEATIPGEILTDVDGVPIGVGPSEKIIGHRSFAVTRQQLEDVGLTPEDVPNLLIIEPPTRRSDDRG